LPERRGAGEQRLLQLVRQPRRQVLAFGIGHFAAFDDRHDFVFLNWIAEPLAQLDDCAEQSHRNAGDKIAARCDLTGDEAAAA
jgi:hypothetical protein